MVEFLWTGIMVTDLRQGGTVACDRERMKILVKTAESWLAQDLSTIHSSQT